MTAAPEQGAPVPATGRFARLVGTYLLGRVAVQALSLLAVPFYVRALGPARFSQVEILTVVLLGSQVFAWGLFSPAALRLGFDVDHPEGARRLWAAALVGALALQSSLAFGLFVLRDPVSHRLGPGSHGAVLATCVGLPMFVLQQFCFDVFAAARRGTAYFVTAIIGGVIAASGSVVLTAVVHMGSAGVIIANAAGYAVTGVVGFAILGGSFWVRPRLDDVTTLFRYGAGLLPGHAALWALSFADRFIILSYRAPAELGQYAAAYRVGSVLTLLTAAMSSAWMPSVLSAERSGSGPASYRSGMVGVVAMVGVGAALVAVVAEPVLRVFVGPAFASAAPMVPWVAAGIAAFGLALVFQTGLLISKRTGRLGTAGAIAAAVNLGACYWLIPRYGTMGAAIATATAYGVYALLVGVLSFMVWRVPPDWPRVVMVGALPVVLLAWSMHRFGFGGESAAQLAVLAVAVAVALRVVGLEVLRSLVGRRPARSGA